MNHSDWDDEENYPDLIRLRSDLSDLQEEHQKWQQLAVDSYKELQRARALNELLTEKRQSTEVACNLKYGQIQVLRHKLKLDRGTKKGAQPR